MSTMRMHAMERLATAAGCAGVALLTMVGPLEGQQPAVVRAPDRIDLRYEFVGGGKRDDGSACPGARTTMRAT
jgi:hypothetical protein